MTFDQTVTKPEGKRASARRGTLLAGTAAAADPYSKSFVTRRARINQQTLQEVQTPDPGPCSLPAAGFHSLSGLRLDISPCGMPSISREMSQPEPRPRRRRRRSASSSPTPDHREKNGNPPRLVAPNKAETSLMPDFEGLCHDRIHVPSTPAERRRAVDEIIAAGVAGFDTEAKPTFRAGQKSNGPHVAQFALTDKAFIFQLHRKECEKATADLIASKHVLKVGFGLKNDHSQIRNRLGIPLYPVLDLDQVFRKLGYSRQIGVRGAMGALLKLRFRKSKSITTSNWAAPVLRPKQLVYAANDAFAALKIMEALQAEGHLKR